MVHSCTENADRLSQSAASTLLHTSPDPGTQPSTAKNVAGCHEAVWQSLQAARLSEDIISVIASSWREGTHKQYKSYIQQWVNFCSERQTNVFSASENDFLNFLYQIYVNNDLGYSTMNTARSAVSTILTIDGMPAVQHPLVCRFMKGVFNQKPALPCYTVTWDISILLDFLCNPSPVKSLDLKCLTLKLLMLSLVLSDQWGQTMHLLHIRNMTLTSSRASL